MCSIRFVVHAEMMSHDSYCLVYFCFCSSTSSYTTSSSSSPFLYSSHHITDRISFQGSYFISSGGVYRTSSVELVPKFLSGFLAEQAEVLQPKTVPVIDDDFTFGGKCTVTNAKTITKIISHSCFYDLCLGSPTDCVHIYAGTRFNFSPLSQKRMFLVNVQNNGVLNPEQGGGGGSGDINGRFALPPSFPGFVFGGIGRYNGIKGSFDLITVAQRSEFPIVITTESPTSSPTLTDEPTDNKNTNRDLSQEEKEEEEAENRELQPSRIDEEPPLKFGRDDDPEDGVIVQKIFITSDQRLPLGPKAI